MKFISPLLAVRDMAVSRRFYEQVMGQTVEFDFGTNLSFVGGLSLQADFDQLAGIKPDSICWQPHCGELYFEEEDLEGFARRLEAVEEIQYVHRLKQHPWGQRVIRFYDPDGHIVEVGEPMEQVLRRFAREGLSAEEIAARTGYTPEQVNELLG